MEITTNTPVDASLALKMISYIADSHNTEYHTIKVIEELHEVGEALVKTITKSGLNKPPKEKIIEECGDLLLRLNVLAIHLCIEDEIDSRAMAKCKELYHQAKEERLSLKVISEPVQD